MRTFTIRRTLRELKPLKARTKPRPTRLAQIIEMLERRELLSSDGFLQGTVYIDSNANSVIDSGDSRLAGATMTLYESGNPAPLASTITDADGAYLFEHLAPGNYHLVETPPAGYTNSFTDASSQLNPVLGTTTNSIDVQVLDPSQLTVTTDAGGPGWFITSPTRNYENLTLQFFSEQFDYGVVTFPATVTGPDGFSTTFKTYCVDLADYFNDGINTFPVLPVPGDPVLGQYAGRIGYLYNHYGTQTLSRTDSVALQIAIWKLIYDSGSAIDDGTVAAADFGGASANVTNNFYIVTNLAPTTSSNLLALETSAAGFINESLDKNEPVVYLDANNGQPPNPDGTAGIQSILATGSFNFANLAKATPHLVTTPAGTTGAGDMSVGGTKYRDLTGNGFSADDAPQAGVTIKLYKDANNDGQLTSADGAPVATTTTASDGTYDFGIVSAGTYYVQESVPAGYVQTGGGPNGTAGSTYYKVVVASGFSYSGYDFDDYQIPDCEATCITYTVIHNGCATTVSDLSGRTEPGDTVIVNFTVPWGATDELTLVSYYAPGASWSDSNAYRQLIYQQDTGVFGPGKHSLTVKIPNSYYQIDLVCGPAIDQLEPNQNGNAYGPDSAMILYHAQQRYIDSDNGGWWASSQLNTKSPSVPAPSSTPTSSALVLADSATLSDGVNPTGTITFYLFAPGVTPNGDYSNNVYSDTVEVDGNGTYDTSGGNNPGGYAPAGPGVYQWIAVYSGDANNSAVAGAFGDEPFTVGGAPISISGVKYLDETGNGFSADDDGLGGVTIKLYKDVNSDGKLTSVDGAPVATTTTAADGSYKFDNLTPATYFVQESVPAGYIQTGGGPNGAAGATYYAVTAASGQTYAGNDFADAELCDLSKVTCVSYVINGWKTVYDLRGNTHPGDTVTVYFTYTGYGQHDFSFVSYIAPGSSFDADTAYLQQIYQNSTITVNGPGKYKLQVEIPNCYYQIDFVCGDAIDQLGRPDAGPDRGNIFYTPQRRLISADNGGSCAAPSVCGGDFATAGFWANRNGQALINSLNGGSGSTALAQWLVTNFPKLYGPGASSAGTCLVNSNGSYFSNSQLASAYLSKAFYGAYSKTNAQILAAALAVYATDTDLAGGSAAGKYGFNTSLLGSGIDVYNVGGYGSTFGESNYSKVAVFELLQDVNARANSNGTLSYSLSNAANSVFGGINQTGNITLLSTGSQLAIGESHLLLSPEALSTGEIWVSIDGLDAVLGAVQETAIDAGIATLNAQLSKYGITLVDVSASADEALMADIQVHLADTTAIGGAEEGVLGLTLFGGDVTLVTSWDWYYGADPTLIGADQFDFQTVVTHELAHALGLGHSTDANSVMFPYLSAGEVRRTLSAADLTLIDATEDGSPEPLRAGNGAAGAVEAAMGALFGAGIAPTSASYQGGIALTSTGGLWANAASSPWTGLAASVQRRRLLDGFYSGEAEDVNDFSKELACEVADAAKDMYQSAIDALHSFFG